MEEIMASGFRSIAPLDFIARIVCALFAGALLGLDREVRHRKVGVRTYMLVSLGAAGFSILTIGYIGHWLASNSLQPTMRPSSFATIGILSNLFAVYTSVGGIAFLVSSNSDRRGRAVGILFAVLLLSFLLNFLAQFWSTAKTVSFLSIMEYYRPALTIQSGRFPWKDLTVLICITVTAWAIGGLRLRQRSICTV